jgi:signal transduction histidine kinase
MHLFLSKREITIISSLVIIFYLINIANLLFYHTLIEVAIMAVSFTIFVLTMHLEERISNHYIRFIGKAFILIAILHLLHALTFQGLNILPQYTSNTSIQLWVLTTYIQTAILLIAPRIQKQKLNITQVLAVITLATGIGLALIHLGYFPDCYNPGQGLTRYKIISEFIIALLLAINLIQVNNIQDQFKKPVHDLLMIFLTTQILSQAAFALYTDFSESFFYIGHILKTFGLYCLYKATIIHGVEDPYRKLYMNLIRRENQLETIDQYSSSLIEATSIEEIAQEIINIIEQVFDFSFVSVHRLEENRRQLITRSKDATEAPQYLPLDGPGVTVRAVKQGGSIYVPDTSTDPDYVSGGNGTTYNSEIAIPFKLYGEIYGVLNVEHDQPNALDEGDIYLLHILASRLEAAMVRLDYIEKLEQGNRELIKLNKMKDRFVSSATHELRTPVTSILGYVEMLQEGYAGELDGKIKQFVEIIHRNTKRLTRLVNDLLDVQRIMLGKMTVDKRYFDFNKLVEDIVEEMSPIFEKKNQSLNVSTDKVPEIMGDDLRISQVLVNLLSNASKYTPENREIKLELSKQGNMVQVAVSDNGVGLTQEDISKLFKPFPDIEKPKGTSSTGLGLSICKGIVEAHGGEIWAESPGPEKGSTFIFTLPIEKP